MNQRRFKITGRVQGVGFRWWVRKRAEELGLDGTVRNLSDGSVEVRARGAKDAMEQLAELLCEGPAAAAVGDVAVHDDDEALDDGFRIVS